MMKRFSRVVNYFEGLLGYSATASDTDPLDMDLGDYI
jgi:hypothetical protein